jgi:hypothetical protein
MLTHSGESMIAKAAVVLLLLSPVLASLKEHLIHHYRSDMDFLNSIESHSTRGDASRALALLDSGRCENVYLDAGTNIGVQIRKVFEPQYYPDAPVLPIFEEFFGPTPRQNLCVFGFEPNPIHTTRLKAVEAAYNINASQVVIFTNTALNTHGSNISFFRMREYEEKVHEWGATAIEYSRHPGQLIKVVSGSIPFPQFILRGIKHRAGQTKKSKVVMKMDIEGVEYTLLPTLLTQGALCSITYLMLEFHTEIIEESGAPPPNNMVDSINYILSHSPGCHANVTIFDDETYYEGNENDFPLPSVT